MAMSDPNVVVEIRELSIEADFLPDEASLRAQIGAAVTEATSAWVTQNAIANGVDQAGGKQALERGLTEAVGAAVQRMSGRP